VQRRKIDRLQGSIQHWRMKIVQLQRETDERTHLLREEKASIQKHYQQLKRRIARYRERQQRRLLSLSQSTDACKSKLKGNLSLAERILTMCDLTRKQEAEQEEVLLVNLHGCNLTRCTDLTLSRAGRAD
jgi:hypothetical protein